MTAGEEENQAKAQNEPKLSATNDLSSELRAPIWSVISFDKCEASGLTYAEAERKLAELENQKVSGLCIVPDEVAARLPQKS